MWATKKLGINLLNGVGKRALDVGCACGYTSSVLEGLSYETVGVDVSRWGIGESKKACPAEFLVCDATALPFSKGRFDLVACFDVLEHLPNPAEALRSLFEVCEGALICTTPNRKVEKLVRNITGDYDQTHINVKPPEEWRQLVSILETRNFVVESFYDLPVALGGKLFFKSFNVPAYGLTVRLAARR
jgi:2-polyprenyl-3-methyl-5-hydroxy-6-metoxy-1,4-benzoquinol methylase